MFYDQVQFVSAWSVFADLVTFTIKYYDSNVACKYIHLRIYIPHVASISNLVYVHEYLCNFRLLDNHYKMIKQIHQKLKIWYTNIYHFVIIYIKPLYMTIIYSVIAYRHKLQQTLYCICQYLSDLPYHIIILLVILIQKIPFFNNHIEASITTKPILALHS